MQKLIALTIGLMFFCFLGFFSPVHAQTVGLSLSPPVVEVLLAPSKQVVHTFTLKNLGGDIAVVPTLHLATPVGQDGHVTLNPAPLSPASIPLIAKLSPFQFGQSIPLSSSQTITLNLTLEGASVDSPVDTYLALVLTPTATSNRFALTSATPAIAGLVLTTITETGVIPANLDISNFDPPLLHDTALPLVLNPTINNHGDVMLHPSGKLTIINSQGETVYQTELDNRLILKDSSRAFGPLTWQPHWSLIGPHRLRLSVLTQGGTKLTEVERTVWFLPLRALIAVLLGCLILATLIIRHQKNL